VSDLNPPNSYSLAFEGSGGAAGFGKGHSSVTLSPADGGTTLAYTAHATVGGKLAQIGSRLIDGVARKMADDFFLRFNEAVAGQSKPDEAAPASPAAPHAPPARSGIPAWAWIAGAIVLVLLALFLAKSTGGQ
jgi:hypothetical protein